MRYRHDRSACTASSGASFRLRASLIPPTAILAVILTAGLHAMSIAADPPTFKVGFDVRNTQIEDARQYQPFLDYLGRATGYRFELRFSRKHEDIVDLLGTRRVDLAFMGAQSYLAARERYGVIPLVRGLNRNGKAEYQSAIVTKNDSPIRELRDLRGKRFAFGSRTSTQGYLIPLVVFSEHGMKPGDFAHYDFTGSHRNCAQAVLRGEYDAGAMQDTLAKEYASEGMLRIIHMSRFYPSSGVAANGKVSKDVLARVRQAFLDFRPKGEHGGGLYRWDRTEMPNGFIEAKDSDYDELRKNAYRFGLLRRKDS